MEGNRSCVASGVRAPNLVGHWEEEEEDHDDRDPSPPALGVGGLAPLGTNEAIVDHSSLVQARHVAGEDNWGNHAGMVIVVVRYVAPVNSSATERDEIDHNRGRAKVDECRPLAQEEGAHGSVECFGDRLVHGQVHRETDGSLGDEWVADRRP